MLTFLPSFILGVLSATLVAANTIVTVMVIYSLAIIKLLLPLPFLGPLADGLWGSFASQSSAGSTRPRPRRRFHMRLAMTWRSWSMAAFEVASTSSRCFHSEPRPAFLDAPGHMRSPAEVRRGLPTRFA